MNHRIKSALRHRRGRSVVSATSLHAQTPPSETIRIGYQKSSTLTAILKTNGELEKALAPLGVRISWHEFTSGLPLLEAINTGNIDFGADVADTVPLFAQAAGAKLAYIAEEAASPSAQAILVSAESPIRTVADLKGKKVAVTKGAGSHFLLLAALAKSGLSFKDISPAYLTPADGRAAFIGGNVDAWVAWDPFLTSAQRQSNARVLSDGSNGLASYKRYYLSSAAFADRRGDVLNAIFGKLDETGKWVKATSEGCRGVARRALGHRCGHGGGSQQPSLLQGRRRDAVRPFRTAAHRRRVLHGRIAPGESRRRRRQNMDAEAGLIG